MNRPNTLTREKLYVPLWLRILLLAALNVAILVAIFVIFLRAQLRPELESFLMAEARERIASVTRLVTTDLESTSPSQWTAVLDRYSKEYGVTLLLYRNTGEQLAGPQTALPPEVDVRLPRGGPPPPPGGNPPPRPPGRDGRDGDRGGGPGGREGGNSPGAPLLTITNSAPRYWVSVRMPFIQGPDPQPLRSVLMLVSRDFFTNGFFFNLQPWLVMGGVAYLISAFCWLPLVRNLTRSIADMKGATAEIAEGHFDVELKAARRDELGSLAVAINRMAGRLQTLTEGRKRFLGDAAHELRSPIARMQVAAEILQRSAQPGAQKYVDAVKDDLVIMTRLTDELLQVARAESSRLPELVSVNVGEAAGIAAQQESPGNQRIAIDIDPSLAVRADREYLIRAISNILRNSLRYAGDHGPIEISAVRREGTVDIHVTDSGPGVPDDALDKIFTPFYRIDEARDRQTGGTGLGLAIVRSCMEACGGTVECRNQSPSGLRVTIRLSCAR